MHPGVTLVVGLGEVGSALADVLEWRGPVLRHDIEPRDFTEPIEVMHICIPFKFSDQFEEATCGYITRFRPRLTIVNSTVIPGTTRRIAQRTGTPAVYSPVRGKHVRMRQDLLSYVKFVAGADAEAVEHAEKSRAPIQKTADRLAGGQGIRVLRPIGPRLRDAG